jgi:hypothetical protein
MAKWLAGLIAALVLLVAGTSARAEEQILSYLIDVTVEKSGALLVSETIEVNAEGNEIRRGIFRDIPLKSLDQNGLWDANGFDIVAIEHNGEPSKYFTEWHGRILRIYIGEAEVFIPSGRHTYRIEYRTTRQLRRFPSYDEVYWNATGNFWSFPILRAAAVVHLPEGARSLQVAAYTGKFGESGKDYTVGGEGTSDVQFVATRRLEPEEGMTVAVGFTKGIVAGDGPVWPHRLWDNLGMLVFALGWPAIAAYFFYAWARVGRDPPGETVIPLFHPPEKLPPDAMSFIHFRTFKGSGRGSSLAFIAALLSLGVKKSLRIEESEKGEVTFVRGEGANADLGPGERELYVGLLGSRESIALTKANGQRLLSTMNALNSAIRREYGGKYFNNNYGWFGVGVLLAALVAIGSIILQNPPDEGIISVLPAIIGAVAGSVLMSIGWNLVSSPAISRLQQVLGFILLLFGIVVVAVMALVVIGSSLLAYRIWGLALLAGGFGVAAMLFLLPAPTVLGAKVMSRIEGFKLYLTTAETNRLNLRDAPQMSEELFERYLPYAAGLGVEEPWSKAYSAHLARVAPEQEREYRPEWYRGRDFSHGISNATRASVAAVSAAMVAAMPAPKSSSGSSGGGSSGGGGGGGGGGGW